MPAGTETPEITDTAEISAEVNTAAGVSTARRSHLSLVFSAAADTPAPVKGSAGPRINGGRGARQRRARDLVSLSPSGRALRRSVQAHALAHGKPVDADALSIVVAAKVTNHVAPVALFTEDMVWQLLWIDVFTWCAHRHLEVPDDIAVTLWSVLAYLDETNGFHPDSDALDLLRSPLMSSAGLGPDGVVRHPTGRRNA